MGGGSKKKQTVGYKYFVGKHMVLCRGPVDFIKEMLVDDKLALSGTLTSGNYTVSKENLFGGKSREGGVSGSLDVLNGEPTQTVNSYLASKLGSFVPAFRGVLSVVLRQMYLGMSPYLKPWSFVVKRIHVRQNGLTQWYDEKAEIAGIKINYSNYQSFWEYQIGVENVTSPPVPDPATITPPSSGWSNGTAPFGVANVTPFNVPYPIVTNWPARRIIWIRKDIFCSSVESPIKVGIYYENSCFVYWNNQYINGLNVSNSQTPVQLYGEVEIPMQLVINGNNQLSIMGMDENQPASGSNTYLEASVFSISGIADMGDMNPAHIIRECLTDPDWGMGYAESDIDDASFIYAADMLYDEGMGMSLLWDTQTSIEEFIQLICRHINATIYLDRRTGLFVLKLIRNDYDEGSLLQLNKSNITKIDDFSRGTFGELVNSVTVTYWNALTRNDATITISDIALVSMQGGTNNSSIDYEGFTNSSIASRVAQRDLKTLSTPLISCTIYANTDAEDLNIGDVFKLTWPDYDLTDIVMRVATIGYGDGKSNRVRLTCTQDIFSMPDVAYIVPTPPDGVPVDAEPVPVSSRLAFEVPYLEAVQQEGQSVVDGNLATNPDIAYFSIAAARPSSNSINAILYTDSGAGYEEQLTVDFCPFAELSADIDRNATSFVLSNLNDESEIDLNTWFQIGTEIMEVTNLVGTTITVKRGLLDTVPVNHSAGETLFFWDAYEGTDPTQYVTGEVVSGKLSTLTASGSLPISSAPADSVTMVGRLIKPYPPGNVKINSSYFPVAILGAFGLTWAHRDRLQQTGSDYIDFLDASIGPETGTTYNLRLYGELDTLLRTVSGSAAVSYDWTAEETDSGLTVPGALGLSFNEDTFATDTTAQYTQYSTGTWAISAGELVATGGANSAFIRNSTSFADVVIECDCNYAHDGGLIVRFVDNNNYYMLSLRDDSGVAPSQNFRLLKRVGGSFTQLAVSDFVWPRGTSKTIRFEVAGTTIKAAVDGVEKISITDSSIAGPGGVGFRNDGSSAAFSKYQAFRWDFQGSPTARLNGRIRFELESVRDGKTSYQKHNVITDRAGYGYNWGKYWGGI